MKLPHGEAFLVQIKHADGDVFWSGLAAINNRLKNLDRATSITDIDIKDRGDVSVAN